MASTSKPQTQRAKLKAMTTAQLTKKLSAMCPNTPKRDRKKDTLVKLILQAEKKGCTSRKAKTTRSHRKKRSASTLLPERVSFRAHKGTRKALDKHAKSMFDKGHRGVSRSAAARDILWGCPSSEKCGVRGTGKNADITWGDRTTVILPPAKGQTCLRKVRARYALVYALELQTSHNPNKGFSWRTGYPRELQPRDYATDKSEQLKVLRGAACLEPSGMVSTQTDGLGGPPILLPSGVAAGGSGRAQMLQLAHEQHPDQAEAYKDYLMSHASHFGFCAADVVDMRRPLLVRVLEKTPDNLREFGRALNMPLDGVQAVIRTVEVESKRAKSKGAKQGNLFGASPTPETQKTKHTTPKAKVTPTASPTPSRPKGKFLKIEGLPDSLTPEQAQGCSYIRTG